MKLYLNCFLNVKVWICLCAVDLTFIGEAFNKYICNDINYIKWLGIAMMVDLITGLTKVWVAGGWMGWRNISSRGLRDTISKGIQYGSFLIITHIVTGFEISGVKVNSQFEWVNKIAFEFLMLIETKSVYENLVKINPKLDFVKFLFVKIYNTYFKKEEEK